MTAPATPNTPSSGTSNSAARPNSDQPAENDHTNDHEASF